MRTVADSIPRVDLVWRMNCEILACWAAPGRASLQESEEGIVGKRVQVDFKFLRGGITGPNLKEPRVEDDVCAVL